MAAMLSAYAAFFSFAYRDLTAATGALLLFGSVQFTMTGYGMLEGERFHGSAAGRPGRRSGRADRAAAARPAAIRRSSLPS